ncbi:hypothetical protein FA13DRAFT_1821652 [Coprinellus micaceus]|uniref:Uncharacterized protein n=1 Tax=Coprinellus micaceus TaxID=71717 RepID=A0A4Y7SBD0_COPMI|nr:hypothetical protein FA13DRAFT_1821652 [Coprinellus micaceus]
MKDTYGLTMSWRMRYRLGTKARGYVLGLISKANVAPESPRKRKRIRSQSPISVDMDESDPLPGPSKVSSSYSGTSASSLNPQLNQRTMQSLVQYARGRSLIATLTITSTGIVPIQAKARPKSKAAFQPMPGPKLMPPANPKSKGRSKRQAASDSEDEGPLPKVTYATLKERQIKDLLQQHQTFRARRSSDPRAAP